MEILVDNDACPVKEEVLRVAERYSLHVTFVSNQGMRPIKAANVRQVVVSAKFDAADDWIVEHVSAGDIVVTNDIPLADRTISKGGAVVSPTGHVFTAQNIGATLSNRSLNAHLRETGEISGHNASFSKKNRSDFLQSLDRLIQQAKK